MTICLRRPLPGASCDLARTDGPSGSAQRNVSERILLQVGFTRAYVSVRLRELLPHDFTLPLMKGGLFLWHFPSSRPDRTLSCTLPCEARTFLTAYA